MRLNFYDLGKIKNTIGQSDKEQFDIFSMKLFGRKIPKTLNPKSKHFLMTNIPQHIITVSKFTICTIRKVSKKNV